VTLRPSVPAIGVYAGWSFLGAALASGTTAVALAPDATYAWLVFVLIMSLSLLPVVLMRCELREDGVRVRNYLRSYHFNWSEVTSVDFGYARFLSVEHPSTRLPRFRLRSGETIEVRALAHMPPRRAESFSQFVERKSRQFQFELSLDGGPRGGDASVPR
jgi:hypothetical protein